MDLHIQLGSSDHEVLNALIGLAGLKDQTVPERGTPIIDKFRSTNLLEIVASIYSVMRRFYLNRFTYHHQKRDGRLRLRNGISITAPARARTPLA